MDCIGIWVRAGAAAAAPAQAALFRRSLGGSLRRLRHGEGPAGRFDRLDRRRRGAGDSEAGLRAEGALGEQPDTILDLADKAGGHKDLSSDRLAGIEFAALDRLLDPAQIDDRKIA